ncbi:MAG TPA: hypothetical protein EYQ86_09100 [Bacteroidetes bacterium]|nr:hypothetical protein [Bacteroidota bacterium]
MPEISFTGFAFRYLSMSLAQVTIGGVFNIGLINTNRKSGSVSLGALNFNVGCDIPISPVFGANPRVRSNFHGDKHIFK